MIFANFEEFGKALGRLYDSTLKNTEDIRELREAAKEDRESARELRETAALLANAVQRDHEVIMAVDLNGRIPGHAKRPPHRAECATSPGTLAGLRRCRRFANRTPSSDFVADPPE